jgi:hypothetical protein
MFQDELRHSVEGLNPYTKEMSNTSRALMSLSAGAIGLLITVLRDQMTHNERIEITIAVAFFLIVIFLWTYFANHLIVLRQEQAKPDPIAVVHSRQKWLIILFRLQGGIFTSAVVMAVVPVFTHFFRG